MLNNIGANVSIATDILDAARSATTPDAGAFEFTGTITVPVNLVSFTGEKKGTINKLQWTTATEVNNTGFELQRSANGKDFSRLAFIASKAENGVSNAVLSYTFEDAKPLASINFYRLKQIDKDGRFGLSNIISLAGSKADKFDIVNLYPNPASNSINLTINAVKDESIKLVVTDIVGKIVLQENKMVKKGENTAMLNVQYLAKGTYAIKAICNTGCETAVMKFTKN